MANDRPWDSIPTDWLGTPPEYALYWAHQRLGLAEGVQFMYNGSEGQESFREVDTLSAIYLNPTNPLYQLALEGTGYKSHHPLHERVLENPVLVLKEIRL